MSLEDEFIDQEAWADWDQGEGAWREMYEED